MRAGTCADAADLAALRDRWLSCVFFRRCCGAGIYVRA
jgi:hypothetical protein